MHTQHNNIWLKDDQTAFTGICNVPPELNDSENFKKERKINVIT